MFARTFLLLSLSVAIADAQTVNEVALLSDAFHKAMQEADGDAGFVLQSDATYFSAQGRAAVPLDGALRNLRRHRDNSQTDSARVAYRNVQLLGQTAVVTELVGAAAHANTKIVPQRRTLVWSHENDQWRLAHVHSSPYSAWEASITSYEDQDQLETPESGGVVFVGSSSIRGWKSLVQDFPQHNVIGRGFGGSQLIDSILYAHRIVTPYKPRAVAVYAGDNDVAAGKSAERVFRDFQMLVETIHADLPQTRIGFIAIKPSLARWKIWDTMHEANMLVKDFADQHESVDYLDIATPMLGPDGIAQHDLFVRDGLHMNRKGYDLWTKVIMPWVAQE